MNPSNSGPATCLSKGQGKNFSLVAYKQLGYSSFSSLLIYTYFIGVQLTYNVSGAQQGVPVIQTHIIWGIIFHYSLLQDIDYSSLCYIEGPCCLFYM